MLTYRTLCPQTSPRTLLPCSCLDGICTEDIRLSITRDRLCDTYFLLSLLYAALISFSDADRETVYDMNSLSTKDCENQYEARLALTIKNFVQVCRIDQDYEEQ